MWLGRTTITLIVTMLLSIRVILIRSVATAHTHIHMNAEIARHVTWYMHILANANLLISWGYHHSSTYTYRLSAIACHPWGSAYTLPIESNNQCPLDDHGDRCERWIRGISSSGLSDNVQRGDSEPSGA